MQITDFELFHPQGTSCYIPIPQNFSIQWIVVVEEFAKMSCCCCSILIMGAHVRVPYEINECGGDQHGRSIKFHEDQEVWIQPNHVDPYVIQMLPEKKVKVINGKFHRKQPYSHEHHWDGRPLKQTFVALSMNGAAHSNWDPQSQISLQQPFHAWIASCPTKILFVGNNS